MQMGGLMQADEITVSAFKQKVRVLLVEDEVLFARAVAKRLQKAGYECEHEAGCGRLPQKTD